MKAIVLTENGGTENLQIREVEKPQIKSTEVLIEVKAIGINPVDHYVRSFEHVMEIYLGNNSKPQPPIIIGWDISGTITAVGSEVSKFSVGDDVFGMINFKGHGKAYAEFVAAPEDHLALKPSNISHIEAAGATLAALTAYQSIVYDAKLKKGEKIIIAGASGGVGHYAVQITKQLGAYVIGVASAKNRDFVLQLGADDFIDYSSENYWEKIKDADVVLEAKNDGNILLQSINALSTGGRLINLLGWENNEALNTAAAAKNILVHRHGVLSNGNDMAALSELLKEGSIKTHISQVFPFEKMAEAHEAISSAHTKGKIIVTL